MPLAKMNEYCCQLFELGKDLNAEISALSPFLPLIAKPSAREPRQGPIPLNIYSSEGVRGRVRRSLANGMALLLILTRTVNSSSNTGKTCDFRLAKLVR